MPLPDLTNTLSDKTKGELHMTKLLQLEDAVFEAQCIANLFQAICAGGSESSNSMDNFTDALHYAANAATENARTLDRLAQELFAEQRKKH